MFGPDVGVLSDKTRKNIDDGLAVKIKLYYFICCILIKLESKCS